MLHKIVRLGIMVYIAVMIASAGQPALLAEGGGENCYAHLWDCCAAPCQASGGIGYYYDPSEFCRCECVGPQGQFWGVWYCNY